LASGRPSGRFAIKAGQDFFAGDWPALLFTLLDRIIYPTVHFVKSAISNLGMMDFKVATDILTRRITADEIAEAAGVSLSSIARARLDPSSSAYRSPPEDWRAVLARLARERIRELTAFADDMEHRN
jgi:hypothetical protein